MSTTPFRAVTSREIYGADISGLQDAVNRCEHVLTLGTAAVTGHTLTAVSDQASPTLHRRIYEGTIRGWLESPAPVIRRAGAIVPTGEYTLFAAHGAIVFHAQQTAGVTITADFTHVTNVSALTGHPAATAVHGATAAAIAERIVARDAAGRAQVATPSVAADIARLDNVNFLLPLRTADRWYAGGQVNSFPMTTETPTANVLRAMPFILSRHATVDRMAINVTAAVAGNARMGIYSNALATMYPAGLIVAAPEVATGTVAVVEATISQALAPGLYWLVLISNVAPTIRALAPEGCQPVLGLEPALGINPGVGWSVAFAYAVLPATFPGGAVAITAVPIPAIFIRASA